MCKSIYFQIVNQYFRHFSKLIKKKMGVLRVSLIQGVYYSLMSKLAL